MKTLLTFTTLLILFSCTLDTDEIVVVVPTPKSEDCKCAKVLSYDFYKSANYSHGYIYVEWNCTGIKETIDVGYKTPVEVNRLYNTSSYFCK